LIGLMSVLGHDDELHMVLASRQTPGRVETASFEVVRQAGRLLARWRWQLWFSVVILEACASTSTLASDMWMFAARGGDILHGNLGAVYSDSGNQGGPLQLLVSWAMLRGSAGGYPSVVVVATVNICLLTVALLACRSRCVAPSGRSPRREAVVGALVAMWLLPTSGFWSGHPAEILIPILWVAAAMSVRHRHWLAAGVLAGAATAVAPWGILALPIVLLSPTRRGAIAAGLTGIVVSAGAYLPFVLTHHFLLLHHSWPVNHASLVHLLAPDVQNFGWDLRVLQAVIVMGACAFVARRCRTTDALWLAPLTAALLRVLTDPVQGSYYWLPLAAAVIGGVALGAPQLKEPTSWVAVALLAYVPFLVTSASSMWLIFGALCLGALTVLILMPPANAKVSCRKAPPVLASVRRSRRA